MTVPAAPLSESPPVTVPFRLRSLAAWAPGASSTDAWDAWARGDRALGGEGLPDVQFLPAMLRRRCSMLSRMVLFAAYEACPEGQRGEAQFLLGSRHGEIATTSRLLQSLAEGEPMSPMGFSHSVHNTGAGLFSIAAGNRVGAMAMSAGADTFACGLLEAGMSLGAGPPHSVLLVVADEPLPTPFEGFADEDQTPYAVALLLDRIDTEGEGQALELTFDARAATAADAVDSNSLPQALVALRWLLRAETSPLSLASPDHAWTLSRRPGASPHSTVSGSGMC